jgi:hypothetical protein
MFTVRIEPMGGCVSFVIFKPSTGSKMKGGNGYGLVERNRYIGFSKLVVDHSFDLHPPVHYVMQILKSAHESQGVVLRERASHEWPRRIEKRGP